MKYTPRKVKLFILAFTFSLSLYSLYPAERKYSITRIAGEYNLDLDYNLLTGQIRLSNKDHQFLFYSNTPFVYYNARKYYINGLIQNETGTVYLTPDGYQLFTRILNPENGKNPEFENVEEKDGAENMRQIDLELSSDRVKSTVNSKKINLIKAIVIDPGHGGKDPGAIGYNGIREKDIVLRTGNLLYEKLKTLYSNKKIIMTRSRDVFIELEDRAMIANRIDEQYGTTLFISIHVNASRSKKSYGFETWHLVSGYTRDIADKRKLTSDQETRQMLNSMLNDEISRESRRLAKYIQDELEKKIGSVSKNRGIKEETYFVIKKSFMPAVLVEIGFNTNKYEAIRLTNYGYLNKIADGIATGVRKFINDYEKNNGFN